MIKSPTPPWVNEDEPEHKQLVGMCMTDSASNSLTFGAPECIERCINSGITSEHFRNRTLALVYAELSEVFRRTGKEGYVADSEQVTQSLRSKGLDGGIDWDLFVNLPNNYHASLPTAIEQVKATKTKRDIRRATRELSEKIEDGSADMAEVNMEIKRLAQLAVSGQSGRAPRVPLGEFEVLPDDDDSALLGENRYICRGAICATVSTSGMGKSSLSIQEAIMYALGRPCFGIKPNGPLRSLVIQSEDDAGDIGEIVESVFTGLELTDEEREIVSRNVCVVTDKVIRGETFISALMEHAAEFKPDLVWINPLQAFFKGDLTSGEDLGNFIREQLGWANRDDKWAYMLIHHTTKPSRVQHEVKWNEAMYNMAGGAELINPCRAIRILEASDKEGEFVLNLAKRGRRAGVVECKQTKEGEINPLQVETVTKIYLKHADRKFKPKNKDREIPMILWEARERRAGEGLSSKAKYSEAELGVVCAGLAELGGEGSLQQVQRSCTGLMTPTGFSKLIMLIGADPDGPLIVDGGGVRFKNMEEGIKQYKGEMKKIREERNSDAESAKPREDEEVIDL